MNINTLAYLGDAIYEVYIRKLLIDKGIVKTNLLQKEAIKYVSAKSQVRILNKLINDNILTERELEIVKRGRNNSKDSHPKNTDVVTYKLSTGFEALIGYLYLNDKDRLLEILQKIEVK